MAEPIRLGLIGAGSIARAHVEAMAGLPDARIVGVTDAVTAAAEAMAEKTGAKVFPSADELAANGGLDALFIFVPPFAHGAPERAALKHRIPFFVEKPVGLDTGLMNEIAQEVAATGLITSVGYMNRYRKSVQRARELLDKEPPVLGFGGWWGGSPGNHAWWTDKKKSGGQFHEQVTHTVDLARYFFGEPAEVYAVAANGFNKGIENYSMDDAVTVAIKFSSGGVANLMASVSSNAGGDLFLRIHSPNHNLHFTGWEHNLSITTQGRDPEEIPGEPDIFSIEDRAFVEAVRTRDPKLIRSDYADGARSAALSLAANRSLETGRPVEL